VEGGEVFELGGDIAGELVAEEGKVLEVLPGVVLGRDLAREEVTVDVKVAEEGNGGDRLRKFKSHNFQIHFLEDRI